MEGKLPELKAIVQYTGPLADNHDNIYDVRLTSPVFSSYFA